MLVLAKGSMIMTDAVYQLAIRRSYPYRALQEAIHVGFQLRPSRRGAEHPLPNEHRTDHDVGGGKPVTEQVSPVAQLAFDHVLDRLEIRPAALGQSLGAHQHIAH